MPFKGLECLVEPLQVYRDDSGFERSLGVYGLLVLGV